jgi:hypothetical protein
MLPSAFGWSDSLFSHPNQSLDFAASGIFLDVVWNTDYQYTPDSHRGKNLPILYHLHETSNEDFDGIF